MAAIVSGFTEIFNELKGAVVGNANKLAPYFVLWISLHIVLQYALPAVWPGIYDFLGRDGKITDRKALAVDARTKFIAAAHATYTAALTTYALFLSNGYYKDLLRSNVYGQSALTTHILHVSVAYFIWDLMVCAIDGFGLAFWVHAITCFCVLATSMHPMMHYMVLVTVFAELSTPFLYIRKVMIQAGMGSGPLFTVAETLFALTFLGARIAFGYYECTLWFFRMVSLLKTPGAVHSHAVVYMLMFFCLVINVLNGVWGQQILLLALHVGGKKSKKSEKKAA